MKSKSELLKEAKSYFDKYPKEDEIHTTGDGNFFLNSNKSAGKTHALHTKSKLITITREDVEASDDAEENKDKKPGGSKGNEITIPDGDPNKDWTKDELIAYGQREYPDLKLTKRMSEDNILSALAQAAKAKEATAGEQGETKEEQKD